MTIGELVYKITGDSKPLEREVAKSDKSVKGLGASFGKFAKLGIAAFGAVAVAGVAALGKELILAASEAEETQNKFDVVFRGIGTAADDAAKNLQDNFGLSGVAAQRMLSDTGDLLVGLGLTADEALTLADSAAQLGTDLASFTNFSGGAEGATDALRKAMLGETESAKALGLVLGETQLKEYADKHGLVVAELTLAEKAQIRLQMAMEQSVNAIGDFERSEDSFANQSRIASSAVDDLKAALGKRLLPIATETVTVFGKIVKALADSAIEFNNLKDIIKEFRETGSVSGPIDELIKKRDFLIEKQREYGREASLSYSAEIAALNEQIKLEQAHAESKARAAGAIELATSMRNEEINKANALYAALKLIESEEALISQARKTDGQLHIEALDAEILRLAELRTTAKSYGADYTNIQLQINDLVAERATLLEGEQEKAEETEEAKIELADAELQRIQSIVDAKSEAAAESDSIANASLEADKQRLQDRVDAYAVASANERGLREADLAFAKLMADEEIKLEQAKQAARESAFSGFLALTELGADKSIALFNLNKGLASADALINSYLAFTKALATYPPPFGAIAGAGVLAAGIAAQIKILGQKPPEFAEGGIVPNMPGIPSTGDRALAAVNPGELILNESQQRNLAGKFGGGAGGNITIRILPAEFNKFLQAKFDNQEVYIK